MNPFRIYAFVLGGSGALLAAYLVLRRKPKPPEEIEQERRTWLEQVGRITDGTVIDVQEVPDADHKSSTLLIFQYDVAGVSYEASQERHLPAAID